MSPKSAGLAKKWGHKNPLVYVDGLPAWKKAGKHLAPAIDYIAEGNIVLIDLRDKAVAEKGYIPRAYSIPLNEMEDAEEAFPKGKGAPIYLYSDKDADIAAAKTILTDWGYKNVTGFHNALAIWTKAEKQLQSGSIPVATEDNPIKWQKKLGPGEISVSDFTKSLQSDLIFIVDARTPVEYESGHFPNAINIPLEQMKSRMAEIPIDKFIVVHCKTGGRGEIGYKMLKEAGYSVKFLNAECECSTSGEYEIW